MNATTLLGSTVLVVLLKWTCLLALGWVTQWLLRHRHARWRLILWRSILGFGLVLPWLQFFQVPEIKIPLLPAGNALVEFTSAPLPADAPAPRSVPVAQPASPPAVTQSASSRASIPPATPRPAPLSWRNLLLLIWTLGGLGGAIRLIRLHRQLSHLQKQSGPPDSGLQLLAVQIQRRLEVHQTIQVRVSDLVTSPFVSGLVHPVITLPRPLVQQLNASELSALLSHEIAHLRQHDLAWCIAWRWMKAVCWFHPLVWRIPAAHNLACEQEADRIASAQLDRDTYAPLLARLALRVLALPAMETQLTLNGSSQIAQRLLHLGRKGMAAWNWRYSLAGFGLVAVLFVITGCCELSKSSSNAPMAAKTPAPMLFKKVLVVVQDENGQPVAGAAVVPDGFRVKGIHGADAYPWYTNQFGPPETVLTDPAGRAFVSYPVEGIPQEKEYTGQLILKLTHPEFSTLRVQSYSVDSPEAPIRLTHGIQLAVSGYNGRDHQPVTELVPELNEDAMVNPEDWEKTANGAIVFHKMSSGGHPLQLMGRLPGGEIVYSDTVSFTAELGKAYNYNLEMRPGIRLEGRIDDQVPRPINNARVLICIRPREFPAWTNWSDEVDALFKKYNGISFWKSYRPIAADGSFVFESIPPGEADVIVQGDGFVSQNGVPAFKARNFATPQAFPLDRPTTHIVVVTEPAATLELTAKTKRGTPIAGATIHIYPNVIRMGGIFGSMRYSSEAPWRPLPPLPDLHYRATTDQNGVAIIRNVPAITGFMDMENAQFQVPLQDVKYWRDRSVRMEFSPGLTNKYALTLEPKGTDYIGKN